jgi:hypothetical protein
MIDHLVYGVPDLAAGVAGIADLTGVHATLGGSHPGRGTHNALLALGPRRYLEIIALDPRQDEAPGLLFPELREVTVPRLLAWAVAVTSIDQAAERLAAANLRPLGPLAGARTRGDGRRLSWQTLRVAPPSPALVPFFIAWDAGVAHPADDAPQGCALLSLTIAHPSPDALRSALGDIAGAVTITTAPSPRLTARLETPKGQVVLG